MAKKNATFVGFLLDETGSMDSVREATVSGFNEYLGSLKQREGKVIFTLAKFNSERIVTVHDAVPLKDVSPLVEYHPNATTPLYDAIAHLISRTDAALSAHRDRPSVLIVIMTDGLENASKEYNRQRLFDLIKRKEAEGWTFAYLGANQDAWAVGSSIGVPQGNSLAYAAAAPQEAFRQVAMATDAFRAGGSVQSMRFFTDDDETDESPAPQ